LRESVTSVCLEWGGWDSTAVTSGRAALHWPPAWAACRSIRRTGSMKKGLM
jgi:hypothetical protein